MNSDVVKIYDKFIALRNAGEFKKLTLEVFESYLIVEFVTPYEGMTTQEYIHLIENGKVIIKCRQKGSKGL